MKPIIITGCKRSGTTYLGALITNSGYWCSHERYFRGSKRFKLRPDTIESSFAAAPFLKGLDAHVIHQVRHPLLVIDSMYSRGDFTRIRTAWTPSALPRSFRRSDTRLESCMRLWLEWNRLVSEWADYFWRFEDSELFSIVAGVMTDCGRPVTSERIAEGASVLPGRINESVHKLRGLSWSDLPDGGLKKAIMADAEKYGYDRSSE